MQIESVRRQTVELSQGAFCRRPEALDAVDVISSIGKLIVGMIDAEMFRVTDINQPVVTAPAVRMSDCMQSDAPANHGLQRPSAAVRDDLGTDRTVALEDAEDNRFPARAATALAAHAARSEAASVNFDDSAERRSAFRFFGDAAANFQIYLVDRFSGQTDNFRPFSGGQIERETADNLPRFTLANFGTPIITV